MGFCVLSLIFWASPTHPGHFAFEIQPPPPQCIHLSLALFHKDWGSGGSGVVGSVEGGEKDSVDKAQMAFMPQACSL